MLGEQTPKEQKITLAAAFILAFLLYVAFKR